MSTTWQPDHYLEAARGFVTIDPPEESTRRSAALLARTGLERALDAYWASTQPAMSACTRTTQLLCLRTMLDSEGGALVDYAWRVLSDLCHYRPYQITPTAAEVTNAIERAVVAVGVLRVGTG